MKKIVLSLTMLLATSLSGFAYDFSIKYGDNVTLGFTITSTTDYTVEVTYSMAQRGVTSVEIPETVTFGSHTYTVTGLDNRTLRQTEAPTLNTVKLPKTLKRIGQSSFANLDNLKVYVPDFDAWMNVVVEYPVLMKIKEFYVDGTLVKDLEVPNTVTRIEHDTYTIYNGIESVKIPSSVRFIGKRAFKGCEALKNVVIADADTVEAEAFEDCKNLVSISFGNSLTEIPDKCCSGCVNLEEVVIGDSVKSIGTYAFSASNKCAKLRDVKFPESLNVIKDYAFSGCSSLESVDIPAFVCGIGNYAFNRCAGISSVTIGNSVTAIGKYAFYECGNLASLSLGASLDSIGDRAFASCKLLSELTIPNSTTFIGEAAFNNCTGMQSLVLGKSLEHIGSFAFSGNDQIATITCLGQTPAFIESVGAFSSLTYSDAKVSVPEGTELTYAKADVWENFASLAGTIPIENKYDMVLSVKGGGKVVVAEKEIANDVVKLSCQESEDVMLEIIPDKRHKLTSIKVNGEDVTKDVKDGKYTLESVDEDKSITVVFEAIVYERHDVNEDGEVNTADVVDIYNRIIYGKDNEE